MVRFGAEQDTFIHQLISTVLLVAFSMFSCPQREGGEEREDGRECAPGCALMSCVC
eukprot:m.256554 g.256554  ORF g.256554 m.256554 type:complete len:56 (-) comp54557_c0_seq2:939-1106(-)